MATNKKIAINANFPFSHYKPVETLSCHSNESTQPTVLKNIIFVEANLRAVPEKGCPHHLERHFFKNPAAHGI